MERVCFTGDKVLGTGSVFARRARAPSRRTSPYAPAALPRPGGPVPRARAHVWDPPRSSTSTSRTPGPRTPAARGAGRGPAHRGQLLDAAWPGAPAELRGPAALTLRAHMEKLSDEGRLPPGPTTAALKGDESGPCRPSPHDMRRWRQSLDRAMGRVAEGQHGVVTRAPAVKARTWAPGDPAPTQVGRLAPPRGIHDRPRLLTKHGHWMAAVLLRLGAPF